MSKLNKTLTKTLKLINGNIKILNILPPIFILNFTFF